MGGLWRDNFILDNPSGNGVHRRGCRRDDEEYGNVSTRGNCEDEGERGAGGLNGGQLWRARVRWLGRRRAASLNSGLTERLSCLAIILLVFVGQAAGMTVLWPDGTAQASPVVLPQGNGVLLGFSGEYSPGMSIKKGDAISIVSSARICAESDDFTNAASSGVAGVQVDASKRVFLDFSSVALGVGYKICVCPLESQIPSGAGTTCPDLAAFTDSTFVTVQSYVIGISGKGMSGGLVYVPKLQCNGPCPGAVASSASYMRTVTGGIFQLSVIKVGLDCDDRIENPVLLTVPTASGAMGVDSATRGIIEFESRMNQLPAGFYHVCAKLTREGLTWSETGVVVAIQDQFATLMVNKLIDADSYVPRVDGSSISVCKTWDCSKLAGVGDAVSFISTKSYCEEIQVLNPAVGNGKASGYLAVGAGGMLAQGDVNKALGTTGLLLPGQYKVCFRSGSGGMFTGTGAMLTVHDDVVGLSVNGVEPNAGLDVAIPRAPGVELRYLRSAKGVAGDSFALIDAMADCASLCRSKLYPQCDPSNAAQYSRSGYLSAHSADNMLSSIPCVGYFTTSVSCQPSNNTRYIDMSNVDEGSYKVCYRPASATSFSLDWPVWRSLGIRATIQASVVGMSLNGVGLPSNPRHAQRLVAPRVDGQLLAYFGSAASGDIAFAAGTGFCSSNLVGSHVAASHGVQMPQGGVDLLLGRQGAFSFGTLQVCFRSSAQQPWTSTGLSLRYQSDIELLEINGVRPNQGVRISVPVQLSSRLKMVRTIGGLVPGDTISLVQSHLDCHDPKHNFGPFGPRFSGYLPLVTSERLLGANETLFGGTDVFASMQAGLYKVCFRKDGAAVSTFFTGFVETGLTLRIQSGLKFLHANQRLWSGGGALPEVAPTVLDFGNNRGVRVALPRADLNLLIASGMGTLSFIPDLLDCQDTRPSGDNPPTTADGRLLHIMTAETTGVLPSRQFDLAMGSKGYREPGLYQVCFKPQGGSEWGATGISLLLQQHITGLTINGVMPNAGLRVAIPKTPGNILKMLGMQRGGGNATDIISLISVNGDCTLPQDNPIQPASFIPTGSSPLVRKPSGHFAVGDSMQVLGVDRLAKQDLGLYKVCYFRGGGSSFSETGITVRLQDRVMKFDVNNVQLLRGGVAKMINNNLRYCVDADCTAPGVAGDVVSIIRFDKDCEDTAVQNPPGTASYISGYLEAFDSTRRLPTCELIDCRSEPKPVVIDDSFAPAGSLGVGNYQICFRSAALGLFESTGVSLQVQDHVLNIIVQNVSPEFGLRVAVPKGNPNLVVSFRRFYPPKVGDSISLISVTGNCEILSENPAVASATSSGHGIKTVGTDSVFKGTDVISRLDPGSYQVCQMMGGRTTYLPSGLSLTVQNLVETLSVGAGARAVEVEIFKIRGQTMTLYGQQQSQVTHVSLIMGQQGCTSDVNTVAGNPDVAKAGWMKTMTSASSGGVEIDLASKDQFIASSQFVLPLTYQLCVRTANGWFSTGIAVKVSWQCVAPGVSTSFAHPSGGAGQAPALFVRESNQVVGATNAIHIIMRPLAKLPGGGVLTVSGLLGSLTGEDPALNVFGNTVIPQTLQIPCLGNSTCRVTLSNYVGNGEMLLSAYLSIEIKCTDIDSCGEKIESVKINGVALPDTAYDKGPWASCVASCGTMRSLVRDRDLISLLGKTGADLQVELTLNQAVSHYTCDGVMLSAIVKVVLLTSQLSTTVVPASWTQITGELVIPVVPFDSNEYMHITIPLRNPSSAQVPRLPLVQICAMEEGGSYVAPMRAVQFPPSSVGGVLTATTSPAFTSASLTQSNVLPNFKNRFTLLLRSNLPFLMSEALSLTVSGLTGTQTLDRTDFPLLAEGFFESRVYNCAGARSCQVQIDLKPTQGILYAATLDVDIFCTDFESYPHNFVSHLRACASNGAPCGVSGAYSLPEASYSRGPWQGCSGCLLSTRKVVEGYDLKNVVRNFPGGVFTLDIGASAGVSSLPCYLETVGVQSVKAIVSVKIEFVKDTGNWQERSGQLVFTALPSITRCSTPSIPLGDLRCLPELKLEFELTNPERAQAAVMSRISAAGGGLYFAEQELGPVLGILPQLKVVFSSALIRERSKIKGNVDLGVGLNSLFVSFETSMPLPEGTIVTILGLTGTQTASKVCTPVAVPSCDSQAMHCIFDASDPSCRRGLRLNNIHLGSNLAASWDQATGTLVFVVQKSFQMMSSFSMSFDLFNSATAQLPVVPSIRASSATFLIPPYSIEGSVLGSGDEVEVVRPIKPAFKLLKVAESSKVEFQENQLEMNMEWDYALAKGSTILVENLDYTQFIMNSTGVLWYADGLDNVKLVPVAGKALDSYAHWQGPTKEFSAWVCADQGWAGSRWCTVQPQNSLMVRLKECLPAHEHITMDVTLRNGKFPAMDLKLPAVSVLGPASYIPPAEPILEVFRAQLQDSCVGRYSCVTSFTYDPDCYNKTCRFLPEQAILVSATITVQLTCSSFEQPDSVVESASLCTIPNCVGLYGAGYLYDSELEQCCSYTPTLSCEPYVCSQPAASFNTGPWPGCVNNCSDSRDVLSKYDVMPLICASQTSCTYPKSPVFAMVVSAGADKASCSESDQNFLSAKVFMNIEYRYKGVIFASEATRLDLVGLEESSRVTSSINTIRLTVSSRVSFSAGTSVSITGLLGSLTRDQDALAVKSVSCEFLAGGFYCQDQADAAFEPTASWKQAKGELVARFQRATRANEILSFEFRILNAAATQPGRWGMVKLVDDATGEVVVQGQLPQSSILTSNLNEKILQAKAFDSSDVMQNPNEILVFLQLNFDIDAASLLTVSGLTGSLSESVQGMAATVNDSPTTGDWVQESGTLILLVPNDVAGMRALRIRFSIINGWYLQSPPALSITVPISSPTAGRKLTGPIKSSIFTSGGVPAFIGAFATESTNVTSQLNRITVSFSINVPIAAGSKFMLNGLIGSISPNTNLLDVGLSDGGCGNVYTIPSTWERDTGTLITFLPVALSTLTNYTIGFSVQNPHKPQQSPSVQIGLASAETNVIFSQVAGTFFQALEPAGFKLALISESSRSPGSVNTISVKLNFNLDFKEGSITYFSGFVGSSKADDPAIVVSAFLPSGQSIRCDASWKKTGVVQLKVHQRVQAPGSLIFSFLLVNPSSPQTSPAISISVVEEILKPGLPREVILDAIVEPVALTGSAFSSQPFGSVTSLSVTESSLVRASSNVITVTFTLNFELSLGAKLTLTGLTGTSSTTRNLEFPLKGKDAGIFGNVGTWDGAGTLLVQVSVARVISSGESITFKFALVNRASPQPAVRPILKLSELSSSQSQSETGILSAAKGATFLRGAVSEENRVLSAESVMTIKATPTADLPPGTEITVTGLIGARPVGFVPEGPGSDPLNPIPIPVYGSLTSGVWYSGQSKVVLTIGVNVEPEEDTEFSFLMENPAERQSPKKLAVSASGTDLAGSAFTIAPVELSGMVLGASIEQEFKFTDIAESSLVAGGANTLSITLVSNVDLKAGAQITLSNLVGSLTSDTEYLPISSNGLMQPTGAWRQKVGTLVVYVGSERLSKDVAFSFSFGLLNPFPAQSPVVPVVLTASIRPTAVLAKNLIWNDGVKQWRGEQAPEESNGQVLSGSGRQAWVTAKVREMSKVADLSNTIFVELVSNTDLAAGAKITVSGLTGSQEPDNNDVVIGQLPNARGTWVSSLGQASFMLTIDVPKGQTLRFSISIINPEQEQQPLVPTIALQMTGILGTVIIPEQPLESVDRCCLSSTDSPRFKSAHVRERSGVPGQVNEIYFSLISNVVLKYGTEIKVFGLTGTPTRSSQSMTISDNPVIMGVWDQIAGSITVRVTKELYYCDCLEACDRNAIQFSIRLTNPMQPQPAPQLRVTAVRDDGVSIAATEVDGKVLAATSSPMVTSAVFESTSVGSMENTITVEVMSNVALTVCTPFWLTSKPSWVISPECSLESECTSSQVLSCYPGRGCQPAGLKQVVDNLISTFVDIGNGFSMNIQFDLGEEYSLQQWEILGALTPACVRRCKMQYAPSANAPDNQWRDAGGIIEVAKSISVFTQSPLLDTAVTARHWRLVVIDNHDGFNTIKYTTIAEVRLFACSDVETTSIVINGLNGSTTVSNTRMPIFGQQSRLNQGVRDVGIWDQSSGSLTVKMLKSVITFDLVRFQFLLRNANAPQTPQQPTIRVVANEKTITQSRSIGAVLSSDEDRIVSTRDIRQSSEVQGDLNTLSIMLQANVPMTRGQELRVVLDSDYFDRVLPDKDGAAFICPKTVLPAVVPCVTGGVAGQGNVTFKYRGATNESEWRDFQPSVIIQLLSDFPSGSRFPFQLIAKNPSLQQSGFTPWVMGSTLNSLPMNGLVMAAPVAGPLFVATIGETSSLAGTINTLTITMVPSATLPAGSVVTISGLTGTEKPYATEGFCLTRGVGSATASPTGLFRFPFSWMLRYCPALPGGEALSAVLDNGGVAELVLDDEWPAGTQSILSWQVKNANSLRQRASVVQIVANVVITAPRDVCKTLDPYEEGVCAEAADVLNVNKLPGLISASVNEQNRIQGQENLITVVLEPNIQLLAGSRITLGGLVGTQTQDSSPGDRAPIRDGFGDAFALSLVSWTKATGILILEATAPLNTAVKKSVSFKMALVNGAVAQSAPTVTVRVSASPAGDSMCGVPICDLMGLTDYATITSASLDEAVPVSVDSQGILTATEIADLTTRTATESTKVPNQDNVITLSFGANFFIRKGTEITVTGLNGTQTPDNDALTVFVTNQLPEPGCNSGKWAQAPGTLIFLICQDLSLSQTVNVSFLVTNPATRQAFPAIPRASLVMGVIRIQQAPVSGSLLKAPEAAAIVKVWASEKTLVGEQENYIAISFSANVALTEGSMVTIQNLVGFDTQMACAASPRDFVMPQKQVFVSWGQGTEAISTLSESFNVTAASGAGGSCLSTASNLTVQLPRGFLHYANVTISFSLRNAPAAAPGSSPSVSVFGCRAGLMASDDPKAPLIYCAHATYTQLRGFASGFCSANDQLTGARATSEGEVDACSLYCTQCALARDVIQILPTFAPSKILQSGGKASFTAAMREETSVISQPNVITFLFKANVAVPRLTAITVTGLGGSQTKSNEKLPVQGRDAALFLGVGNWKQQGILVVLLEEDLVVDTEVEISITLVNMDRQDEAECINGRPFCTASGGGSLREGLPCSEPGRVCSGLCVSGKQFCSGAFGPPQGDCSGVDMSIPGNVNAANNLCVGSLCTLPNTDYQCPKGGLVYIANASTGSKSLVDEKTLTAVYFTDYSGLTLPLRAADCNGGGSCSKTSTCTSPNTGAKCTAHAECTGVTGGQQRCVRIEKPIAAYIKMQGPGQGPTISFPNQQLTGKVLGLTSPLQPEFVLRTISESSRLPGAENILTVSLSANFPLQSMALTSVTLSGLMSGSSSQKRLPLVSSATSIVTNVACDASPEAITCGNLGKDLVPPNGIIMTALLTIYVNCGPTDQPMLDCGCSRGSGQCKGVITSLITPCGDKSEGFTPLPCAERVECQDDGFCAAVNSMDVLDLINDNAACNIAARQGFWVKTSPGMGFGQARAVLEVTYSTEYAVWDRPGDMLTPGTLTINGITAPSIQKDPTSLSFSFLLLNRPVQSPASDIFVQAVSGSVKKIGLCEDKIDVGCTKADEPSRDRAIMQGQVLTADGREFFKQGLIHESSSISGGENTITIYLEPFVPLAPGTIITVTGFKGSKTQQNSKIAVLGAYTSNFGTWASQGSTPCCDTLSVRVAPRPFASGIVILSFTLKNSDLPQAQQSTAVLATGGDKAIGGFDRPLVCVTKVGCTGVLSSENPPAIIVADAFEKHRFISLPNVISFSLRANAPLHTGGGIITVSGLGLNLPTGPVPLVDAFGNKLVLATCAGVGTCVFTIESTVPNGATILGRALTLSFGCKGFKGLVDVMVCGDTWGSRPLSSGCIPGVDSYFLTAQLPRGCGGLSLIDVSGIGNLNVSASLDLSFSLGVADGGQASWTGSELVIKIIQNLTEGSVTLTDPRSVALSIAVVNSAVPVTPVFPTISGISVGRQLSGIQVANGILGSTFNECKRGELLQEVGNVRFPAGTTNVNWGTDDCVIIVQPVSREAGQLISVSIVSYLLDESLERLIVYNGDSPASSLAAIITSGQLPTSDPRWYKSSAQILSDECSLSFSLESRRVARLGVPLLSGFAAAAGGFALKYKVQDPEKMDYVKFVVELEGLTTPWTDINQKLKFRKALGGSVGVMYSAVLLTDIKRRDSGLLGRRQTYSSSTTSKMLTSDDAIKLADQLAVAFDGGKVTNSMTVMGMQGSAKLIGQIQVFRCGYELNCGEGKAPPPPPSPNRTIIATPAPNPFPLVDVVTIGGVLIGAPIAVGIALVVFGAILRWKRNKKLKIEREDAIAEYQDWVKEKIAELDKMDDDDRTPDKGLKPKGIWRDQTVQNQTYAPFLDMPEDNALGSPATKWPGTHEEVAV